MNVNIKPLKWVYHEEKDCWGETQRFWRAEYPFGYFEVYQDFGFQSQQWVVSSKPQITNGVPRFDTADEAKLGADRLYTLTVLDCLQPEAGLDGMEYLMLHDWCLGLHEEVKK